MRLDPGALAECPAPIRRYSDDVLAHPNVDAHRRGVAEYTRGVKRMSALTAASKAFRATLNLPGHELSLVERWAEKNCALHALFPSDRGRGAVLIGLRSVPQTSSSFARTIRNALCRFGVATAGLRGHWLFRISRKEALSVCLGSAELSIEAPRRVEEQRCNRRRPPPSPIAEESDERVVELIR